MKNTGFDVANLAVVVDEIRETLRAVVAGLMDDGFSEEQARAITTGIMGRMAETEKDDNG